MLAEERDRLVARHLAALDRKVRARDLPHLGLDALEILGGERPVVLEVVVEAVLDDRADRHLRLGEQALDRLRHEVRRRMADDLEALRRIRKDRRDDRVALERPRQVDDSIVDAGRDRLAERRSPSARSASPAVVPRGTSTASPLGRATRTPPSVMPMRRRKMAW